MWCWLSCLLVFYSLMRTSSFAALARLLFSVAGQRSFFELSLCRDDRVPKLSREWRGHVGRVVRLVRTCPGSRRVPPSFLGCFLCWGDRAPALSHEWSVRF